MTRFRCISDIEIFDEVVWKNQMKAIDNQLLELYRHIIAVSAEDHIRTSFESRGFRTSEKLEIGQRGELMEIRSSQGQVQGYFDLVDWSDDTQVEKVLVLLSDVYSPKRNTSEIFDSWVDDKLGEHNLYFCDLDKKIKDFNAC